MVNYSHVLVGPRADGLYSIHEVKNGSLGLDPTLVYDLNKSIRELENIAERLHKKVTYTGKSGTFAYIEK